MQWQLCTLLCGLGLFLLGMSLLGGTLAQRRGTQLETQLRRLTRTRAGSWLAGFAVTAAVHSSSAVTVLLVGLVDAGLLPLSRAADVIMGANTGTTVTAWLLCLRGPDGYTGLLRAGLLLLGAALWALGRRPALRSLGRCTLGLGILLYGMAQMSASAAALQGGAAVQQLLAGLSHPLRGLAAGALTTAVIQSSTAGVGILQALCTGGHIPLTAVVPIILGQNIGTCVTACLAAVRGGAGARQTAAFHLLFNALGAALLLPLYLCAARAFPALDAPATGVRIALAHTLFNVLSAALLAPLTPLLCKWCTILTGAPTAKPQKTAR